MNLHGYTIAYFCHAERDVGLDPIPSEFINERQVKGEREESRRITAGEHLRLRQENTYKQTNYY